MAVLTVEILNLFPFAVKVVFALPAETNTTSFVLFICPVSLFLAFIAIVFCTDIKAVSVFRVHFIFDFAKSQTNAGGKSFKQYFAKSITKEIVIKVFDRTPRSDVNSPTL